MTLLKKYIFFLLTGVLFACHKDIPDATIENSIVSITFHSPLQGDVWEKNVETHIEAIIDADAMMGGWSTLITTLDHSDTLDFYSELYEQTQYIVHHHWIPPAETPDTILVRVFALDKQGLKLKEASVSVKCL